jgi:hypothetical protein
MAVRLSPECPGLQKGCPVILSKMMKLEKEFQERGQGTDWRLAVLRQARHATHMRLSISCTLYHSILSIPHLSDEAKSNRDGRCLSKDRGWSIDISQSETPYTDHSTSKLGARASAWSRLTPLLYIVDLITGIAMTCLSSSFILGRVIHNSGPLWAHRLTNLERSESAAAPTVYCA